MMCRFPRVVDLDCIEALFAVGSIYSPNLSHQALCKNDIFQPRCSAKSKPNEVKHPMLTNCRGKVYRASKSSNLAFTSRKISPVGGVATNSNG